MPRPRCYLDIEIDNEPVGRIIVELFNEICPITCENFRALCTGEKGLGQTTKKPLWYKNTVFHRVVKNFVIQSGDFEAGNGTGGESIYGGQFADENFTLSHDKPFLLSMANKGKNTNGSQFFITLQASPHLDQLHTVFGHVICGHEVIKQIENIKIDQNNKPLKEVKIAQCGELVLRSDKRKKRKESTSESSSSEEEKRKKRKKHKKEKKKNKKDKKAKGFYSSSNKAEDDIACNVDPDEIPAVPANVFLMRRTSPVEDREYRRAPRGRENFQFKRYPPSRSRSGRKVKGRGNMRYRTPSSSDERSGSETPPHWKQAQSRLKKLKEVIKDKDKDKDSASDVSNEEDGENRSPHNPFLQSRLGLVSTKKFDDDNRRKDFDDERRRNFEDRRRDFDNDRRRDFDGNRREFDGERRSFGDDRRKKDARMNINENRRRRDFSPESSKYNRDDDEPENLFDKLMHEDQQHGTSWFDEKNQDQSDEESECSPLRSKIVVKSSVSRKDTRDDRRDERESNRRYNENSRRRDSPYKRSRDRHRESSSGRDNSYRKSEHPNENRKETSKNTNDKKNENPKKLSGKTKKRLNLLENDLFRYTKQEIIPKKDDKLDSETNDEKNTNKQEVIQASLINSVNNSNLAALKEYETKSNEKCGHESNDSTQAELSKHGSEKSKHKAEENLLEALPVKSNTEPFESQVSDSSSLQKVVEYETGKEQEADPSIKVSSNFRQLGSLSIPVPDEESSAESEANEKERSPLNNSKYYENDKTEVQKPVERDEQKSQPVEKEVEKFIKCEEENEYSLPDIIPLPGDNIKTGDTIVKKNNKVKIEAADEKEIETQNTSANFQVAENSSIVSLKTTRDEFQSKEKKIKHDIRQKISPSRHSSNTPPRHSPSTPPRHSPSTPPRRSPSTPHRRSPSTPRRRSPSTPRRRSPSPPRRHSPSPPRRHSPSPPRRHSPSPPRRRSPSPPRRRSPSPPRKRSPSLNQEPQRSDKKIYSRMSVSPSRSKSPLHHKTVNQSDNQKPSSSKQSLHSRRSKSPVNRAKSPISRRKRSDTKTSKSRSRSRSARRSTSRNRVRRKYSRSPNVRQRRSRSRSHNAGRGSRSYRHSGIRNRSPELRSSFQRRNRSPYRGRVRGRSASRRSNTRSRSHSFDKKHRRRRQVSSSSSSSSSSRSDNVKRRNLKNSGAKSRNKRRSSSSSSSASSRSKRSNS